MTITKMKKVRIMLIFLLLAIAGLNCSLPLPTVPFRPRTIGSNDLEYEFDQIPNVVNRGETAYFSINTRPGTECYGEIEYWDTKKEFRGHLLPPVVADEHGKCVLTWDFQNDFDIEPGFVNLIVVLLQEENSAYPLPKTFCAVHCP